MNNFIQANQFMNEISNLFYCSIKLSTVKVIGVRQSYN